MIKNNYNKQLSMLNLLLLLFFVLINMVASSEPFEESYIKIVNSKMQANLLMKNTNNSLFNYQINREFDNILIEQKNIQNNAILLHKINKYQEDATNNNFKKSINLLNLVKFKRSNPSINLLYYPLSLDSSNVFNDQDFIIPLGYVNKKVEITLAKNQKEPLSFVLQNLSDEDIKVNEIHFKLYNSNNELFPESNIDTKIVKNWFVGSNLKIEVNPYELTHPILAPELLLKDDSLVKVDYKNKINYLKIEENKKISYKNISSPDIMMPNIAISNDSDILKYFYIEHYKSKQIWLSVDTSNIKNADLYVGSIVINYEDKISKKELNIPFYINVLNLNLSKSKLTYGVYYASQVRLNNGLKALEKSKDQYMAELIDLKEHNILYPTIYVTGDYTGTDSESMLSFYLQARQKLNFPCDKVYFVNASASNMVERISMLKRVVAQNTVCKNSDIYIYGRDEAKGDDLLNQRERWELIHSLGAKIFASSASNDSFNLVGDLLDTLIYRNFDNLANPEVVKNYRKLNKDVFLYGNPQSGIPNAYLYRSGYGYYLIKNNYTGAMDFAYQIAFPGEYDYDHGVYGDDRCKKSLNEYCSAWNHFSSGVFYNHMFTYPTSNGVVDTLQWEAYASSLADLEYYQTLIDLMSDKCQNNNLNCDFNPQELIDVNNPVLTRQRIIDKIKILIQ